MSSKVVFACALLAALSLMAQRGIAENAPPVLVKGGVIHLTSPDGQPIYISVAQLVAITPPANDADHRAKAWIALTSGRPLAVRETPREIITMLQTPREIIGTSD